MVRPGEQNHRDLAAIVDEINRTFAGKGPSFVYLPGDIADDGSVLAYRAVRECLDRLALPWCAIVGDHDVHERSYENFRRFMSPSLHSAFTVGPIRFFRLNAFAEPRPDAFLVDDVQLDWLEHELQQCSPLRPVVLLHCYPSDLKQGGERLAALLHMYGVRLVDMGHTHYNEIGNDGRTLYSATRSTGQIEEGPVGYSVISFDGDAVSWHFQRLGTPALVSITSPADARLLTEHGARPLVAGQPVPIRAKVFAGNVTRDVFLEFRGTRIPLAHQGDAVWSADLPAELITNGLHELTVTATGEDGAIAHDRIQLAIGTEAAPTRQLSPVDQENALAAWPERDLLGTQLGPNKNGKKW